MGCTVLSKMSPGPLAARKSSQQLASHLLKGPGQLFFFFSFSLRALERCLNYSVCLSSKPVPQVEVQFPRTPLSPMHTHLLGPVSPWISHASRGGTGCPRPPSYNQILMAEGRRVKGMPQGGDLGRADSPAPSSTSPTPFSDSALGIHLSILPSVRPSSHPSISQRPISRALPGMVC